MSKDIRLLADDERDRAKALWKEAFNDSDAFINWYFANKLLPGNSLCMFEGGQLISIVHMIPYTLSVQGRPLQSAFIAGVATAKNRRGEGLMRTMLHESLALLQTRGILMTHLYPFSHAFYEAFGWAAYSYVNRLEVSSAPHHCGAEVIETMDKDVLAPLYNRMMRGFDGYIIRGAREWDWRLGELASDGGRCAVLLKNGSARAYMLYYGIQDKAEIIETVYSDEEDISALLSYVLSQGYGSAQYDIPAQEGASAIKHGMARVVDAQGLLSAFDALPLLDQFDIEDGFTQWNSLSNGNSRKLTIGELALLVHCGTSRLDSEKMGRYFVPKRTCIFEAF